MKKVITYGTFDLIHRGHIRLLERAKELGDYLIVGVTADGFDQARGKINVSQSVNERIEGVRATGLADEIIVEEYEGQKIDDIRRLGIDVFTVGSDWQGHFDYLSEYCDVVYLDRTQGISSTEIRSDRKPIAIGFVGAAQETVKHPAEVKYVNGMSVSGLFDPYAASNGFKTGYSSYQELLAKSDAVFVLSKAADHYGHVKAALEQGKHVICESPLAMLPHDVEELFCLADSKGLVLMEGIKTAYSTAYHRLSLLVQSGTIGRVASVQSTCTSLADLSHGALSVNSKLPSADTWLPTALLPILQFLGCDYRDKLMVRSDLSGHKDFDVFGKVDLVYEEAVGSAVIGKAVKSEGSLCIAGTDGYIWVPSPWWKTDYFEVRRENPSENRRYFYQLEGEGIRNELASFARSIQTGHNLPLVDRSVSIALSRLVGEFKAGTGTYRLKDIDVPQHR